MTDPSRRSRSRAGVPAPDPGDAASSRPRCGWRTRCRPSAAPVRPSANGSCTSGSSPWRTPNRSASGGRSAAGAGSACGHRCGAAAGIGLLFQLIDSASLLFDQTAAAGAARQDGRGRWWSRPRPGTAAARRRRARESTPHRRPADDPDHRRCPMTRLTRADLDALPAYVPGRSAADLARELGIAEAIKLASNEVPYGPLPGVVRGGHRGDVPGAPLPRHGRRPAARQARRAVRRHRRPARHRLRLGGARRAPGPRDLPARRRDRLLMAVLRGVPDHRRDHRRDKRPGAEHGRARARPGRDGRRDHRPDPDDPGLQPEQPDGHQPAQGASWTGSCPTCPPTSWW